MRFFLLLPALVATQTVIRPAGAQSPASAAEAQVKGPVPPGPLTSRVAIIVGRTSAPESSSARLLLVRRLSPAIPSSDASALLAFAAAPMPAEFTAPLWQTMVNDIFDLLLRLGKPPQDLGRQLLRMTENEDPVLADYGLQKLDKLARLPVSPFIRQEAAAALANAAMQDGSPSQGTALLAWQRMVQDSPDDSSLPAFRKAAAACLQSPSASMAAKTAALSAATAARMPGTAGAARRLLVEPGASISLQISALHALGATGGKEDIPLITQYLSVLGCGPAAAGALKKL